MDETELRELTLRFNNAQREQSIEKFLQRNPKYIFVLRLALGLSQKHFIQRTGKKISQVTLIKHEKGRSSRMNSTLAKEMVKLLPSNISINTVITNFRKFNSMKKGYHMTTERARELQKIWLRKTKKAERQEWGRQGALKTNTSQRLTEQERKIKEILDKSNLNYKIHQQIKTKNINMNIDFVIWDKSKPKYFIEVTERKHDLPILCQAYAYRCRLLKEAYPKAKVGIIIKEPSFSAKKVIENEFDFMLNSDSIQNLSKFLQF